MDIVTLALAKKYLDNQNGANTLQEAKEYTDNLLENANMVKSVSYESLTHKITFTFYDNTTQLLDLPLESTIVGASYDNATKDITFTLQNNSTLIVPLDDLVSGLASETWVDTKLGDKVDKVTGKGLSTNDYTTTEKNKLAGIASGAEVNVQSDWNASSGDALILNKPAIPTKVSDLTNDAEYITEYTETDPIFTAWNKSTGISITKSQVSDFAHNHDDRYYTETEIDTMIGDIESALDAILEV